MIRFNDDIDIIDITGPLRILRLRDGYYVVGEGMCCSVNDGEEAREFLTDLKRLKDAQERANVG